MKQYLYVIVDNSTQTSTPPFCSPNSDIAKRNAVFGCLEAMTPVQDITLYCVGEFIYQKEDPVSPEILKLTSHDAQVINISSDDLYKYREQYKELRGEEDEE